MKINYLQLHNFRNYENLKLNFGDNLNIIYGNNGVGKTNLVEAIYALSITKSFRTNNDKFLIKHGQLSTKIEGEVETNTVNNYEVIISKEGKKVKIDGNIISKISDYISNINIVLLEPEEQNIFKESPSSRRKLLNIELSKLEKDYIIYLNIYNKILKQRNFYLREAYLNGNSSKEYLDIITKKLVTYGLKIYEIRKNFIEKINLYLSDLYLKIFKQGNLIVKYNSDFDKSEQEIIDRYNKNYNREVVMGKSLYGIHHDDLIFYLDNQNIAEWGSNGQQKNAIFSFKLAEIEVIKAEKGMTPILILDDLFSALDNQKVKNIVNILDNQIQTFITTTDLNKISKKIIKNGKIFNIKDEEITEV